MPLRWFREGERCARLSSVLGPASSSLRSNESFFFFIHPTGVTGLVTLA
jgi:hypothetical protein